jgi:hypothetical protein
VKDIAARGASTQRRPKPVLHYGFVQRAADAAACRLAVLPVGNGKHHEFKAPRLSGFTKWQHRPGKDTVSDLKAKHQSAMLGIVTGPLSGVTVVDVDDAAQFEEVKRICGESPIIASTPSGGAHLWYRYGGESNANLRRYGYSVDIKGKGGFVVAPPSRRGGGKHYCERYEFISGCWESFRLADLPPLADGAIQSLKAGPTYRANQGQATSIGDARTVQVGHRNNTLFKLLLRQAPYCVEPGDASSFGDLLDVAETINDNFPFSLPSAEVEKTARSVWAMEIEGRNWTGSSGHVAISQELLDRLLNHSPQHGADALALYVKLRTQHAARHARNETFAIAARAMAEAQVLPWWEERIRRATKILLQCGVIEVVHQGGKKPGDPSQYRFTSQV